MEGINLNARRRPFYSLLTISAKNRKAFFAGNRRGGSPDPIFAPSWHRPADSAQLIYLWQAEWKDGKVPFTIIILFPLWHLTDRCYLKSCRSKRRGEGGQKNAECLNEFQQAKTARSVENIKK